MHLITPVLRDYAWGTTGDIAELLGIAPTGAPIAEAWWGTHDTAPSAAQLDDGPHSLRDLIASEPDSCLGPVQHRRWGARLPFLLKLLAIDKPLSIQVHPTLAQARAGFDRENAARAPTRQFRDPYHKPELVYALTPMTVLAGVRDCDALREDLSTLRTSAADGLAHTLGAGRLDAFMRAALALDDGGETLDALAEAGGRSPESSSLRVSADALARFPGDRGAIVALALNVVELAPGDAVYTGAGVLHSYQSGLGIEVMANSDNVVRAGLTPKHVDVSLLLELADTVPSAPERPDLSLEGAAVTLTTPAEEFALTVVTDGAVDVPAGPRIVLVVQGEATVRSDEEERGLRRGQAVFVRADEGAAHVVATGTAVVAHLPRARG